MLEVPVAKEPPTELRLFAKGATATTKGPVVWNDRAAKATMAAFKASGLDQIPFDVGHGMLNPFAPPEGHKAFGWFTPEARSDGLYAADIEWTEDGAAKLSKREFRFYSPAIMRDGESGEVAELINVALTNLPATRGQKPLVADNTGVAGQHGVHMDELEKILKLLGLRSADELLSRWAERSTLESKVLSVTGEQTVAAAQVKLDNMKIQADSSVKLAARVTELEATIANGARDAKIEALSKAGKLPPALHPLAKTFTLEQLSAFEAAAPVIPEGGPREPAGPVPTALSATELEVVTQLGLDPAKFLAEKQEQAKRLQMGA